MSRSNNAVRRLWEILKDAQNYQVGQNKYEVWSDLLNANSKNPRELGLRIAQFSDLIEASKKLINCLEGIKQETYLVPILRYPRNNNHSQAQSAMTLTPYEKDFYAWTQEQAHLLRTGQLDKLDWQNLAEEIADMGRSEKRQLESRLEKLVMHLLKWQFQPNLRSRSWRLTIKEQRLRLEKLLQENPSLKSSLENSLGKIYPLATLGAEKETGLSSFPETCPYTLTEILSPEFLPEAKSE